MKPGDAATTGTQPEPEPCDPTAGLIAFLRSERFQATAEDIADAFWLAERLPGVPRTILVSPDSASTTPWTDRPGPEPSPPPKPAEVPDWRYIYAARTDLELPGPCVAVRVPSPPTLPETLAVAKALRPLMRREPSRLWYSIDPDATARRQTEERIWEPILMPQLERWLSVALVLDVGSSMDIWHPTLNALRQLLEQMGAFRRVQTWILKTDVSPPLLDSYRPGVRGATTPTLRLAGLPPRTILEPGGRHLVLVVSDCVGRAWHEGEVARLFAEWHRAAPVALIQILPGWLWPRTALSVVRPIRFLTRGSSFASKPQWLIADDSDLVAEPLSSSQDMTAVPIPIATLEPESLHDLARTLSGRGALHGAGVLLEVPDPGRSFRLPPPLPSDPDELVGAFRRTATEPALRLATLLAAAPTINLPIIRLVAEAMMPGLCRRQHQAEVWLAGLLHAVPETATAVDPEAVRYDFRPGIRDRLLDALPRSDALEVLERTSTYIETHLGRLSGLAGMLANPKDLRPREQLRVTDDPLARIASDVLLRLGGDYARLVQETKPQASKRSNHVAPLKSGIIRIFVSYSRRDKRWLDEFRTQIQPLIRGGLIDPWDDSKIKRGQKWREEIVKAIEAADIAVLLVSPDFLASEFIASEELAHLRGGRKTVFWIAIDHSNYKFTSIANYQCANDPSAPLASLKKSERSRAWVQIGKKLLGMISGPGEPVAWNVPYPRNPNFTGREAILAQLEKSLASGAPAALTQAIAGLGGVGKTQTAVEFAYRHRDRYRAVLWVRADTETNLASGYRALAEVLGLPVKDVSDSHDVVEAVRRWLGREPGYLLILDSADDPALVRSYLPPKPKGHILLTSRAHNFALGIRKPIELPVLEPAEAMEFLVKRTGREGPLDPAERDAARTLAEELDYLPLALEQGAAYMKEHEEAFSVYLAAYRVLRLKLFSKMGPVVGDYPDTVRTLSKRSLDAVAESSPGSIALLRLSAFFAPDAIPYELILEGASEFGGPLAWALATPPGGEHALTNLLTPLARHSLVRRDPRARTYSVHRLIQALLRDELAADARRDLAERAVKALNRAFPDVDYADWPQGERLLPHARTAKGWIESENLRIPEAARLLNRVGFYLYSRGRYDESESLIRRALAIRETILGPDHTDTATSLNNLAVLLRFRGRYEESESLIRRALAIREQALGPDHPDTAISLNNLAITLQVQSRYAEAELLLRQALAIREQALGPDHPDTATSLNDLAGLLRDRGRPEEAEPLLRRGLATREKILGPDHPDTAISLNNMARLLQDQGRYGEAERLYRRALAIREAALGPDHPDTLATRHNIARWTGAAGDAREALRLYSELLPDQERVLGRDHPHTLTTRGNVARWTGAAGDAREALRLYSELLPDQERVLGRDHPDTAISLNDLAALLLAQGRLEEAEPLLRRALAIRETILGPDHTDTTISLNNLAELLRIQGRLEEAERLNRRALAIRETILGPDHTDTAISLNNLALSLKRKLESLSSEKISDEEDNEPKHLLVYLHKTLRCDFDLEPSGLEERLVAFLMEYRPYTLTGLDKAYSLICDQNLKTAASRIDEIIRLVLPFQLPQELWARVLEQHKQGRTVLANAAPGVVFAEAVAARIDGKPIGVSLDGEGIKAPNRFGPFPVELPPLDAPEETLRSLVKVLLISAHLETGRTGEAGTMTVAHMMSVLRGFFEWWRNLHQRTPYVVVRMPKDPNDRTNYERALAQIKEGAEHVMFLEYYADPVALMVEGGLLGFLHTHRDSERKWKTP